MFMQIFDSRNHLLHNFAGMFLGEFVCLHDSVEEFAASAVLHYNVYVTIVNKGLVELDNVRVVDLSEYKELFFQELDVFCDI